jgi:hypothetical protein
MSVRAETGGSEAVVLQRDRGEFTLQAVERFI